MTTERWNRVQEIFHEALERTSAERAAFLSAACAGDADLREEVETMLKADTDVPRILNATLENLACLLPDEPEDKALTFPREIGPYKIIREVGCGGMGTVYLAERADVGKRVALKVLRSGLLSSTHRQRFLSERRILARLDHPNIAHLLDAGVTDDGMPFFAMEYVEGLPIDRYADEHRLTIRQRLRLFQTVCEAVHYAHRNLLVHRDLKPSNILVTEAGEVKLLDFGIAKLLEEDETDAPTTRTGLRAMTPEYASPEQISGEPITTASDVYTLGVLLYELLTSHRPYHIQGQSPRAFEEAIREAQPERPSVVVMRTGLAPRSLAATGRLTRDGLPVITPEMVSLARSMPIEKLRRRLRGDLDNIVLMALRKEPERRYPSAEQLLKDLSRHLRGLPVEAQQDTLTYRTSKFVSRHRWGVGATTVAVAVVSAFLIIYSIRIRQERDRARLEADKADEVAQFLYNLFDVSDPFSRASLRADTMKVRDFLKNRAMLVEDLDSHPEIQLPALNMVAKMYRGIGLHEQADTLSAQAIDVARMLYTGDDNADLARTLNERADLLRVQGNYDEAEDLLREALGIHRNLIRSGPGLELAPELTQSLNSLAELLREKGNYGEAEVLYKEALDVRRELWGAEDPKVAESMNNLGLLLYEKGALAEAEQIFRDALKIYQLVPEREDPQMADVLDNLGHVMERKGEFEAAERIFDDALELKIEILGDDNWRVAEGLINLGRISQALGNLEVAEGHYWEAIKRQRLQLGAEHWRVASAFSDMASLQYAHGDLDRAAGFYRKALEIYEKTYPEKDHLLVAASQLGLGKVLTERGEAEEGQAFLERALQVIEATYAPDDWHVAEARMELGAALTALGRYDEAERLLTESRLFLQQQRGLEDPLTQRADRHLIAFYIASGRSSGDD